MLVLVLLVSLDLCACVLVFVCLCAGVAVLGHLWISLCTCISVFLSVLAGTCVSLCILGFLGHCDDHSVGGVHFIVLFNVVTIRVSWSMFDVDMEGKRDKEKRMEKTIMCSSECDQIRWAACDCGCGRHVRRGDSSW